MKNPVKKWVTRKTRYSTLNKAARRKVFTPYVYA
jgi:hypothetical protein